MSSIMRWRSRLMLGQTPKSRVFPLGRRLHVVAIMRTICFCVHDSCALDRADRTSALTTRMNGETALETSRGALFAFVVAAVCNGCAHQISISPNLEQIAPDVVQPKVEQAVGYFISAQNRALEVTTPGGGGDSVRYLPYADLESGLARVLSNVFSAVHAIKDVKDQAYLQSKNITWVFTPTITTTSSSRNAFFWPPTDFSVSIDCVAADATQREIWKTRATADGGLIAVREIIKNHALAATTAGEKALRMLQMQIQAAPVFGVPSATANSANNAAERAMTRDNAKDPLPAVIHEAPERSDKAREKMRDEQSTAATSVNMTTEASVPQHRQLPTEERRKHFENLVFVTGSGSSIEDARFEFRGGSLTVREMSTKREFYGSYRFEDNRDQICIVIQAGGRSQFKMLQDCYKLFEVGKNKFALRSVNDRTTLFYTIN
jgi:hypothetical protein